MQQEIYTKDEIDWSYIEFVDNKDILDLIEKVLVIILISEVLDSLLAHLQSLLDGLSVDLVIMQNYM